MHHMVPAFEFRARARKAMKAVMPILLVVALIATLPSLIQSAVFSIADANPDQLMTEYSDRLTQVLENHGLAATGMVTDVEIDEVQLLTDMLSAMEQFQQSALTFLREKGLLILALSLMVMICSPVLTMRMINSHLHALRGQEFTPIIALSRSRYVLKILGLMLMFALRLLLWMLPGMAIALAALIVPVQMSGLMMIAGSIVMIVMGIIASYRYAMINYFMADDPALRIRDCFRRSCEVMQRRKLELFSLEISFIGWRLLLSMVQSILLSFGAVIGLTLGMFASLFLTVYTNCAKTAFYQEYAVGPLPKASEPEPEEDELQL